MPFASNRPGSLGIFSAPGNGGGTVESLLVKDRRSISGGVPTQDARMLLYAEGIEPNGDVHYVFRGAAE